jgi:hypothetical protein
MTRRNGSPGPATPSGVPVLTLIVGVGQDRSISEVTDFDGPPGPDGDPVTYANASRGQDFIPILWIPVHRSRATGNTGKGTRRKLAPGC